MTLSAASYNTNPQPQGQFYVKFNDAAWNCEMAVVFCADPAATMLPAGKYVYADTEAPGTISPKTYITIYSPYLSLKPAPGTEVDVKLDGTKYTVTMDFIYDNGRSGTMTFSGEISETPTFTEAPQKHRYEKDIIGGLRLDRRRCSIRRNTVRTLRPRQHEIGRKRGAQVLRDSRCGI